MKSWLEKIAIEIYTTNYEVESVIAERFIRTLKNKIYRYHRTIKMKPVNLKQNTYIDSSKEINDKDLKFKIGYIVRISKF